MKQLMLAAAIALVAPGTLAAIGNTSLDHSALTVVDLNASDGIAAGFRAFDGTEPPGAGDLGLDGDSDTFLQGPADFLPGGGFDTVGPGGAFGSRNSGWNYYVLTPYTQVTFAAVATVTAISRAGCGSDQCDWAESSFRIGLASQYGEGLSQRDYSYEGVFASTLGGGQDSGTKTETLSLSFVNDGPLAAYFAQGTLESTFGEHPLTSPVPEPTTGALFGVGLALAALQRRRLRSRTV